MKNTKVSQDLLGQINNFKPLLHKTAEYDFMETAIIVE